MSVIRQGTVYVRNVPAGILQETDSGYLFRYHADYLNREDASAVSLTMPLRPEPYVSYTLFPFFDGLIPEGWLLDVACRNWKINQRDRFGLLLVACKDCIGSVAVRGDE